MAKITSSSIAKVFSKTKNENRAALIAYYPFGFPDIESSVKAIKEISKIVDLIEVGVPFSDPTADGPVIQKAYEIAVKNKVSLRRLFEAVDLGKIGCTAVIMSYLNPIFKFGAEKFVNEAALKGYKGVIVPDMPPEEKEKIFNKKIERDFSFIFLASPTDSDERLKKIASETEGFLYLISSLGVTGERERLDEGLYEKIKIIKSAKDIPVCVGFGVSKPEHVEVFAKFSDGFIVGSAIVRRVFEEKNFKNGILSACKLLEKMKEKSYRN